MSDTDVLLLGLKNHLSADLKGQLSWTKSGKASYPSNETCSETAGKEVLSLFDLKYISLEFLGATRWRDSPEKKAKMRESEIKGSRVGWECCLDIIFISGVNQAWNFQLCKPTNSLCSGHFAMAFATNSILIYPLFHLTFLLSSTPCLVYIAIFVLVH